MSEKKESMKGALIKSPQESNKLDAIRSILYGEQTELTDLRFAELKKSVESLHKNLEKAEQKFSERLIALESAYANKQTALEHEMEAKLTEISEKIVQTSNDQRQELGGLLIQLGTKIQG